MHANLTIPDSGITHPVLIDVVSGDIQPIPPPGANGVFANLPVRDSVMAIADENYFDWPVLPEAPSALIAKTAAHGVQLQWRNGSGQISQGIVERRAGHSGPWSRIAQTSGSQAEYTDAAPPAATACYRVRSTNSSGESAYSNVACSPQ